MLKHTLPMPGQTPELHYQPGSAVRRHKRRNRVLAAIVAVLLIVLAIRSVPYAVNHCQLLYWQDQCMNYEGLPETIAWTMFLDPNLSNRRQQQVFNEFTSRCYLYPLNNVVFLHERISPSGNRRLVAVAAGNTGSIPFVSLLPSVFQPATLRNPPFSKADFSFEVLPRDDQLKVHEGQIDPSNPSHFTIVVETDASKQTYDGWLNDDDTVSLERRTSPSTPPPTSSPASSP